MEPMICALFGAVVGAAVGWTAGYVVGRIDAIKHADAIRKQEHHEHQD